MIRHILEDFVCVSAAACTATTVYWFLFIVEHVS